MKAIELAKAYDPKEFEDRIYRFWKESGSFKPEKALAESEKTGLKKLPYVVVIPPPNVTGILHLGHGLVTSIIDIVIRYHRMKGEIALWVPGTDHAGIATQHVVEKMLLDNGKSRHDLGREKFLEKTWQVKEEHREIISRQTERMGASVDWDRERFTMDEGLSKAVREVFVLLYERDLLYKGNYLVNWCCKCGTALADDEVEHEEKAGKMYRIKYPLSSPDAEGKINYLEIATTRPETMLGDTAVAVHPEDERYASLTGKKVILPLAGREITIIADPYVDRALGTGALKVTPAHDPNDWELAKTHNLEIINILEPDGRLNNEVPEKYRGLTVSEARDRVLEDLKEQGFYAGEENIKHSIGCCYRCNSIIEPYLSEQWFVRMKPMAEKALSAWKKGEIIFYPKKWENTYERWLNNIRDWCISRQLWWGHRIPAWYCADCGQTSVSRMDLEKCEHCNSKNIEQDPDVLDTWFSSWLWPFSVFDWTDEKSMNSDLENFYPTTALVTAYDIIFFWVARMIMAGLEFTGKAPFRDVYIHQLIRDKQGRKMSKSLGNGIDPLEIVEEFGADALKFTLAFLCAQGQDILMDRDSFKLGSRFANKIWNASRFILLYLDGTELIENPDLLPVDKWIYSRFNNAVKNMEESFLSYRFNDAAQYAYEFFWNDFCDWYLEAAKLSIKPGGSQRDKNRAVSVLLDVLSQSLKLLHPLLPFLTEEIYNKLPNTEGDRPLISAAYPVYEESKNNEKAEKDFGFLQDLVRKIRAMRSECTIAPDIKLKVRVNCPGNDELLAENSALVKLLAGLSDLEISGSQIHSSDIKTPKGAIALGDTGFDAFVFIADAVDMKLLKQKLTRELEKDEKYIQSLGQKLSNEKFLENAPPELVAEEKVKYEEAQKKTAKLRSYIKDLD